MIQLLPKSPISKPCWGPSLLAYDIWETCQVKTYHKTTRTAQGIMNKQTWGRAVYNKRWLACRTAMITFVGSRALMAPQSKSLCLEFLLRCWSPVHQGMGFDLNVSGSVRKCSSPPFLHPEPFSSTSFLSPQYSSGCNCLSQTEDGWGTNIADTQVRWLC